MGVKEIDHIVQKNRVTLCRHTAQCRVQGEVYRLSISLLLKELPSAEIVSCRGRDSCTSSDDSLSIILLSPTTCTESRGHPRMQLAFLISLSSLLLSAAEMLLHQQTTP